MKIVFFFFLHSKKGTQNRNIAGDRNTEIYICDKIIHNTSINIFKCHNQCKSSFFCEVRPPGAWHPYSITDNNIVRNYNIDLNRSWLSRLTIFFSSRLQFFLFFVCDVLLLLLSCLGVLWSLVSAGVLGLEMCIADITPPTFFAKESGDSLR